MTTEIPLRDARTLALERGPIAAEVLGCLEAFGIARKLLVLEDSNSASEIESHGQLNQALEGYQGLFRVWSGNVGAHQAGKVSLDHRLKDASFISSPVERLLRDLRILLGEVQAILRGDRQPAEAIQYGSGSSDEELESDEPESTQSEMQVIALRC